MTSGNFTHALFGLVSRKPEGVHGCRRLTEREALSHAGGAYGWSTIVILHVAASLTLCLALGAPERADARILPAVYDVIRRLDVSEVGIGDTGGHEDVTLAFVAFGKSFTLDLARAYIDSADCQIVATTMNGDVARPCDSVPVYSGHLDGDDNSVVSAVLVDQQLIAATVRTSEKYYVIQPASALSNGPVSVAATDLVIYEEVILSKDEGASAAGEDSDDVESPELLDIDAPYDRGKVSPLSSGLTHNASSEKLRLILLADKSFSDDQGLYCTGYDGSNCQAMAPLIMRLQILEAIYAMDRWLSQLSVKVIVEIADLHYVDGVINPYPLPRTLPTHWEDQGPVAGLRNELTQYKTSREANLLSPYWYAMLLVWTDVNFVSSGTHGTTISPPALCTKSAVSAIKGTFPYVSMMYATVHEIGHQVGVTLHDQEAGCSTGIMGAPFSTIYKTEFSSCSRSQISNYANSVKSSNPECFQSIRCGDVDGDGQIDSTDALQALGMVVARNPYSPYADVWPPYAEPGVSSYDPVFGYPLSATDVLAILKAAVGPDNYTRCGPIT